MLHWARGEGVHRQARGSDMWFKVTGADSGGRMSLMERVLPPGGRMPLPHRHVGNYEAYYVLDGSVEIQAGGEVHTAAGGSFYFVAAGEMHTFGNVRDTPARLLVLHAPALDGYFKALEQLWAGAEPPSAADEVELMRRHGMEPE